MTWTTVPNSRQFVLRRTHGIAQGLLAIALFLGSLARGQDFSQQDLSRAAWRPDAELTDVWFSDERNGWAVGDHGTVLTTNDGGETWLDTPSLSLPQIYSVTRWESVRFLDQDRGWIAGGFDYPYVDLSRGVILQTQDGGRNWQPVGLGQLPRIFQIAFDRNGGGWAVGRGSTLHPTGLFTTATSGQQWSSDDCGGRYDLRAAVVTERGWIGVTCDDRLVVHLADEGRTFSPELPRRIRARDVVMQDGRNGFTAGANGELLCTRDAGVSWFETPGWAKQKSQFQTVDFESIAVVGDQLWLAGNPGSELVRVNLTSGLATRHATGCPARLNRIRFLSDQIAWAVGVGGTMVRTRNGGATWELIRGGFPEITLLNVSLGNEDLAYEPLTRWAAEEGFLAACLAVRWDGVPLDTGRLNQAVSRLGASCLLVCHCEVALDNTAWQQILSRRLAESIRQLKPRVIVCNASNFISPGGQLADSKSVLEAAIRLAADRNANVNDRDEGAPPWQVDRLAIRDTLGSKQWQLYADQTLPRIGESIADHVAVSRALADLAPWDAEPLNYQVVRFTSAGIDPNNLLGGLIESGRRLPRRSREQIQRGNLASLKQLQNKDHNKQSLLTWSIDPANDLRLWQRQVAEWIGGADYNCGGVWLAELAESYLQAGNLKLALASWQYLTERYPDHLLAPAAHRALLQAAASIEATITCDDSLSRPLPGPSDWMAATENDGAVADSPSREAPNPRSDVALTSWESNGRSQASQARRSAPDANPLENPQSPLPGLGAGVSSDEAATGGAPNDPPPPSEVDIVSLTSQQTSVVLNRMRSAFPELVVTPEARWCEAKITRLTRSWSEAKAIFQALANGSAFAPQIGSKYAVDAVRFVATAASKELSWQDSQLTAAPLAIATRALSRPRLDGVLDDAIWSESMANGTGTMVKMTPPTRSATPRLDVLLLSYDSEFLYVACRCSKIQGHAYRGTGEARPRDSNLDHQDRIALSFDLDRDGLWPFVLTIDSRGWMRETCGTCAAWNPQWFVAVAEDQGSWSVEAAIPLSQFGELKPESQMTWGLGCRRMVSRYGTNLWSWPAPALGGVLPTGSHWLASGTAAEFGLLRFE